MTFSNHANAVKVLHCRCSAAKLVSLIKAQKVIQALKEIYSYYGKTDMQIFDKEHPSNSKRLDRFAKEDNIKLHEISLLHTSSNLAETFMWPLGK